MGSEIFVNGGLFETRIALMEDHRLIECLHLPYGAADGFKPSPHPMPGMVCLGRITRIAPELDAAFADVGLEAPGYLPASATAGTGPGKLITRCVSEGQLLPVQIIKPGHEDKGPQLSSNLSTEQMAIAGKHLQALRKEERRPGLVLGNMPSFADALSALQTEAANRIYVDHPSAFARLKAECPPVLASKCERIADGDLFSQHGVEEQIDAALEPVAPLPSGGNLIIEATSALTAIDVNSGSMTGSELRFRLNREAAEAIPAELRLRGIGGQVVIDFLPLRNRKQQNEVMGRLHQACQTDPAHIKISRLTPGGLAVLTRERLGLSLAARFFYPRQLAAPKMTPGAASHRMIRELCSEARQPGERNFHIMVAPGIADWLAGRDNFQLAARQEFGINLTLQADETQAEGTWTIKRA